MEKDEENEHKRGINFQLIIVSYHLLIEINTLQYLISFFSVRIAEKLEKT